MRPNIYDFSTPNFYSLISEKPKDFVGRKWVFDEIDNWLNDEKQNKPKYFIVTGKAGSGKSTIAAKLIEISNGDIERSEIHSDITDNKELKSIFQNIKKGFLDAFMSFHLEIIFQLMQKPLLNLSHPNWHININNLLKN